MKNTTIGQFIRALRLQRGITQEILAARAGISSATMSSIERDVSIPQEATSARLLDMLRLVKEVSKSEQLFAKTHMRLPEGYSWEAQEPVEVLTWDVIEGDKHHSESYWIQHCVREMTYQLGQEAMLDALLALARSKGLIIPRNSSF